MPAFVAGALEGDTKSMMTSYHALNGIPASASPVIRSELREALGWEGMMMSDGGAISYMLNFKSNEAMKDLSMLTARPALFASRSVRRALLTPQVNPRSRYRCSRST